MAGFRMTPKRFTNLSPKNAEANLFKHEVFLNEFECLSQTLTSDLDPTSKFQACQSLLSNFILQSELAEAEAYLARLKNKPSKSRYLIRILNKDNETLEVDDASETHPMEYSANDYASAERLADRRIFERSDAMKAVVIDTTDHPIATMIERREALARILARPKSPVCRMRKVNADPHWKPKSHATRSITRWAIPR